METNDPDGVKDWTPIVQRFVELEKNGEVEESVVMADAARKDSPFHSFVWNCGNMEAASRYRLERCRQLICRVRFILENRTGGDAAGAPRERMYFRLLKPPDEPAAYGRSEIILASKRQIANQIAMATAEARGWVGKFGPLWEKDRKAFACLDGMMREAKKLAGRNDGKEEK